MTLLDPPGDPDLDTGTGMEARPLYELASDEDGSSAQEEDGFRPWLAPVDERPGSGAVTSTRSLPEDILRKWSLAGMGIIIVVVLVLTVLGMASKWFGEDFAKLMLQMVVPPLLSAFAVVVGYLFAERKRG